MSYLSTTPDEWSPLLQRRLTWVLGGTGGLFVAFLLYVVADYGAKGNWGALASPATLMHAAAGVGVLGAAVYCSRGNRTIRQLNWVDTVTVLTTGVLMAVIATHFHIGYRTEYWLLMASTILLVGRSALVPSTPRRTVALGVGLAVPLAVLTWSNYADYRPPAPGYPTMSSAGVTIFVMIWWAAAVSLGALVSRVIYGLRRAVDKAMRLGQYGLEEKIGEGGMGSVYRASHAMLRRPTAVKLLLNATEEQIGRFEREVQLTASLSHPNTVAVFDYGRTPDGVFYYAMEYLAGSNLQELVDAHGPQPPERVVHILAQVCGALHEAHRARLIHRDVKPANIIVCERGGVHDVAKVVDFGLVKATQSVAAEPGVTAYNAVMGTPLYMSPEAIKTPDQIDAKSDLYALGAVGYFLLTGNPVFESNTVVEVCAQHLHSAPTPPSELVEDVPKDLEQILLQCLSKDPEMRPTDAASLSGRLAACTLFGSWTGARATAWWNAHGTASVGAHGQTRDSTRTRRPFHESTWRSTRGLPQQV